MDSAGCDETLTFTAPDGAEVTWSVVVGDDQATAGADAFGFRTRYLRVDSGTRLILQRRLAGAGPLSERDAWERRLDLEIRAALRLARRFGGDGWLPVLPNIVGYRIDVDEPFALWEPAPGAPLTGQLGRLLNDDIDQIYVDVLTAAARLAAVGIVHRAIAPDTVRWDGNRAYLDDLGHATVAGEPREPAGSAPWSAPEQRKGIGVADPRDDVWSIAVLLGRMVSGGYGGSGEQPQPGHLGPRFGALLGDLLDPVAARRPTAAIALERLSVRVPAGGPEHGDGGLSAGRRRFDELIAGKTRWGTTTPAEPIGPINPARPEPPRRIWFRHAPAAAAPPPLPRSPYPPRRCYLCLDTVQWTGTDLTSWSGGKYEPLDLAAVQSQERRDALLRSAFQRCPNPSRDAKEHFLPVAYLCSDRPVNIAVVGRSGAGKSHLLTGMMREIEQEGLAPFDVQTGAVDMAWHDEFRWQHVVRLYDNGRALEHTRPVTDVDFTDGLLLTTAAGRRPLMFFDVAGEQLLPQQQRNRAAQFLSAVDALLFVADPQPESIDPTFGAVLDRLDSRRGPDNKLNLPAAIVVTKSDLARFDEPVDRWIGSRAGSQAPLDWGRVIDESRDAYAYLHRRGRKGLLAPFARIRDCTLHFASATGASDVAGEFPRGARPQRCLEPLLALLYLLGALPAEASASAEVAR